MILYSIVDGVETDQLHSTHPLLESEYLKVGLSFMACKYLENAFQVIYVKNKVNAIE